MKLIIFLILYAKLALSWNVQVANFTYYSNSIAYAVNTTNSSDLWLWVALTVNKYDISGWTATDGSQGFFVALALNSESFNHSNGYLCMFHYFNLSTDSLQCRDVDYIYPNLTGPPSVG